MGDFKRGGVRARGRLSKEEEKRDGWKDTMVGWSGRGLEKQHTREKI